MSLTTSTAETGRREYAVFISYRHADNLEMGRKWANWLHEALESYEVPPDLVGKTSLRGDKVPASLYPVFRDEAELPADADLSTNIRRALENSGLLVVLCSPRAVQSRFVEDEIRYFKELGKSDRMLALMIDGEPNASDDPGKVTAFGAEAECFPYPLRFGVPADGDARKIDWNARTEPIAADVRPGGHCVQGWTTAAAYREQLVKEGRLTAREVNSAVQEYGERLELAKLKVVAGALGLPLGELTQRDKAFQLAKAKRRQKLIATAAVVFGVLAVLALAGAFVAWQQKQMAVSAKREVEEKNVEIVNKNEKITIQNETNLKNLHEASMADYAVAVQRIEKDGKWHEGVAHLARALKWEPGNALAAIRIYSTLSSYAPEKQNWPRQILRHEGSVVSAQFSPDGTRIVTASNDMTARVWDAASGKPIGDLMRHEKEINSAQFSPDGKRIVTASRDKTVRVWDATSGRPIGTSMRHEDNVRSARFSPDGKRIVTASQDKTARVWEAASGKLLGEPLRHESEVNSAQFSPDASRIVTGSDDKTARVWDVASCKPLGEPMHHEGNVNSAQFSPDGTRILTVSSDCTTRVWDAASGKPLSDPMLHEGWANSAEFSPDGTRIVTACFGAIARIWDAISAKPLGEPMRHESVVLTAQFSADGRRIVTTSVDTTARVWDAASGRPLGEPMHHEQRVYTAQFSADGTRIVTASRDNTARVWDAASGKPTGEPLRHQDDVLSAQFSPDGSRIATSSFDNTAWMWDAATGRSVGQPMRHPSLVHSLQFSADSARIVTANFDNTARVWDAASGKPLGEPIRHRDRVTSAQFSPGGTLIVTASVDGTAQIWDAASRKPLGEPMRHEGSVNSAKFSPDGRHIVTASDDNTARLWDAASGKPLGKPMRHRDNVNSAQFSLDNTRVVTASDDNTARLWDAASGKPLGEPMHHSDIVTRANFNPDGTCVVTASDDNTARLWDATSGKPLGAPMAHGLAVNSSQFSPDGKFIVTASDDNTVRMWEAASGKPLGEPLRHGDSVTSAEFSPDGASIVTASEDNTARIWELKIIWTAPLPVPEWMLECMTSVAGLDFTVEGQMKPLIGEDRLSKLRLPNYNNDDAWSKLSRWILLPANARTLTPGSKFTCRQIAERERDYGSKESLESALCYDPTAPLVHLLLAAFEDNPLRADALRNYELKSLPEDASLWSKAASILIKQEQPSKALESAQKAVTLGASQIIIHRTRAYALNTSGQPVEALQSWDKVLADKEATFVDFINAGNLATKLNLGDKSRVIFREGEKRFPASPSILRFKGLSLLRLHAPEEALAALQAYKIKQGANSMNDAIAALAVSRWLTGDRDGAVEDYLRLSSKESSFADVDKLTKSNWPDTIKQPMLEVLAEIQRRYPELVPKKIGKDDK